MYKRYTDDRTCLILRTLRLFRLRIPSKVVSPLRLMSSSSRHSMWWKSSRVVSWLKLRVSFLRVGWQDNSFIRARPWDKTVTIARPWEKTVTIARPWEKTVTIKSGTERGVLCV